MVHRLEEVMQIAEELSNQENQDGYLEIREKALDAFRKLMQAGLTVHPRDAKNYLDPAIEALKLAGKMEMDRKYRELREQEIEIKRKSLPKEEHIVDDILVIERNSLLEKLLTDVRNGEVLTNEGQGEGRDGNKIQGFSERSGETGRSHDQTGGS